MNTESEKIKVLSALEAGDYIVTYEPCNNITERTKYDGSKFYVFEEDDVKFGVTGGKTIVEVASHTFEYDIVCEEWEGDDLIEDEEITEALEEVDGFIDSEDYDQDRQWELYAEANKIPKPWIYYSREDPECPVDIDCLNGDDVEIPLRYGIALAHGACSEFMDMTCIMSDEELYSIYKYLKETGEIITPEDLKEAEEIDDEEEYEISDIDIQSQFPDLHDSILSQVEEQASDDGYDDEDGNLHYFLVLSNNVFEENLGGSNEELF